MAFKTPKQTVPKSKMMNKQIPQKDFFEYISKVAKAIQDMETEHNGKKFDGLVFSILKMLNLILVKKMIFCEFILQKINQDTYFIQEKSISKNIDNYLKKN